MVFVVVPALSDHRWFKAIRHSLVLLLPVIFVGAVALLVGSFPFTVLLPHVDPALVQWLRGLAAVVSNASHGILSLCLVVLISHRLAVEVRVRRGAEISPPLVASVALVNFFVFVQLSSPQIKDFWTFGSHGVLSAIVVAIFSSELLFRCLRAKVLQVGRTSYELLDPTLHMAVRSIIPVIVTVIAFLLVIKAFLMVPLALLQWAGTGLVEINHVLGSQLPGLMVLGALNQLLWFVGIHGPNVLIESVYPIMYPATGDSRQIFDVTKTFFDLYIHIGGSGSTLGLLLAIWLHDRRGEAKRVAKYALIPSLFNINELVIFGLPIAFNPIYLIPFLAAPLIQIALTYVCIRHGLVTIDVTTVPWTTPPVLAGAINSESWRGGALQCFNILLSTLIYTPFVRLDVRRRNAESIRHVQRVLSKIEVACAKNTSVLDRLDEIGHIAGKLLHDFQRDFGTERVYLAYQPQHDSRGRVVGVEALLRWEHQDYGPISSGIICALLEEDNRIFPLGHWALETACGQLRDWDLAGINDLRMSVNVSPLQLRDTSLVPLVEECLRANRLPPSRLTVELTESQKVPEDATSIRTLRDLHAMGVNLEVDDFGMGYASMLYVRRFHFDAIKLDGSLTKEVLLDNHCSEIITSVVQLARALEMRIVAEFVESREQQLVLEQLGCDIFQGYLYSPALRGDLCLDYLRRTPVATLSEQLCISIAET